MNSIRKVNSDMGQKLNYFLATGNLVSKTGLDLSQVINIIYGRRLYTHNKTID